MLIIVDTIIISRSSAISRMIPIVLIAGLIRWTSSSSTSSDSSFSSPSVVSAAPSVSVAASSFLST